MYYLFVIKPYNLYLKTRVVVFSFFFFPAKYYLYDNYFDLPGALLCARVVDSLDQVRTGLFEIKCSIIFLLPCLTFCMYLIMHASNTFNEVKVFSSSFLFEIFHARLIRVLKLSLKLLVTYLTWSE